MKRMALALSLAATLACASDARAQTMTLDESLKATHELLMQAVRSANVAMITTIVHPQAMGFFRDSQRLVELRPGVTVADMAPTLLADLSLFDVAQYGTTVRQTAGVGVVTLGSTQTSKKKNDRFLRSTYVYVRVNDTWKLYSWHTSDMPRKK